MSNNRRDKAAKEFHLNSKFEEETEQAIFDLYNEKNKYVKRFGIDVDDEKKTTEELMKFVEENKELRDRPDFVILDIDDDNIDAIDVNFMNMTDSEFFKYCEEENINIVSFIEYKSSRFVQERYNTKTNNNLSFTVPSDSSEKINNFLKKNGIRQDKVYVFQFVVSNLFSIDFKTYMKKKDYDYKTKCEAVKVTNGTNIANLNCDYKLYNERGKVKRGTLEYNNIEYMYDFSIDSFVMKNSNNSNNNKDLEACKIKIDKNNNNEVVYNDVDDLMSDIEQLKFETDECFVNIQKKQKINK